jgi:hypothetical protein
LAILTFNLDISCHGHTCDQRRASALRLAQSILQLLGDFFDRSVKS